MTLEFTVCLCLSMQDNTHQQFVPVTAHPQHLAHLCAVGVWWCPSHRQLEAAGAACPFTPHICPHTGRRQYRRLLVLGAASQAGPKLIRWLLAPLDVVPQLILLLWRECTSLSLRGNSSCVQPTQALQSRCSNLQRTQPLMAGKIKMEP